MPSALSSGKPMPQFNLPTVGGGDLTVGKNVSEGRFTLFSVYRGLHCPLCKLYNAKLEEKLSELDALGVDVVFVTMSDEERAKRETQEWGMTAKVAYGMSEEQAKSLGLYVSNGINDEPAVFSEPGLFGLNPAGTLQLVDVSNAPFLRPDVDKLIMGLQFVISKGYPARGTRAA